MKHAKQAKVAYCTEFGPENYLKSHDKHFILWGGEGITGIA